MENLIMNRNGLAAHISNIGCKLGEEFYAEDEALESLQSIWALLSNEDPNTLSVRRHLGALGFGPKVLVPLLQYVFDECNEDVEDPECIYLMACQFLVALTEPVSVLVKPDGAPSPGSAPGSMGPAPSSALKKDMAMMLMEIRNEFLNPEIHRALFKPLLNMLRKTKDDRPLTPNEVSAVNAMLYIYRNLLIDRKRPSENLLIVGLMFQGGLQKCCHLMFSRPEMNMWVVAFVQLLPIIYCNECDLLISEVDGGSVFGKESKTLMQELSALSDKHNMDTTLPQSPSAQSMTSFSSEQDSILMTDGSEKDSGSQEGEEVEEMSGMKKIASELFSQSFENMDDTLVDNLMILLTRKNLRTLAEDFIENAFADLLYVLKGHLLCGNKSNLSATYVGWVVHYFLAISKSSNMPFKYIKEIISYDMVGFLVYEICMLQESLLSDKVTEPGSVQSQLEMCVKGLASIIEYVHNFTTTAAGKQKEDVEYMDLMKLYMMDMMNLGEMFVFLLRHCPSGQESSLLKETILLNHKYLLFAESLDKNTCHTDITCHIEHFATPDLLVKMFGVLDDGLMNSSGGKELMNAVFTMAYHVVADHGRIDCIAQPSVLSTLCSLDDDRLLDTLSSEHIDMVNHIMKLLFGEVDDSLIEQMKAFDSCEDSGSETETSMETVTKSSCDDKEDEEINNRTRGMREDKNENGGPQEMGETGKNGSVQSDDDWNEEEVGIIMDAYTKHSAAGVKKFLEKLHCERALKKSPFQILYKLLMLEILSEEEFKQALADTQDPEVAAEVQAFVIEQEKQQHQQQTELLHEHRGYTGIEQEEMGTEEEEEEQSVPEACQLNDIIMDVHRTCPHEDIQWLQQQLMEACFVKSGGRDLGKPYAEEPLYLYSSLSGQPMPIPILTEQHSMAVSRPAIRNLLKLIGCDLDSGIFPRLPALTSPVELFMLIKRLAPTENIIEKIEETDLVEINLARMKIKPLEKFDLESHNRSMPKKEDMANNLWPQIVYMFNNSLKVTEGL